jgi:DNA modification methylase
MKAKANPDGAKDGGSGLLIDGDRRQSRMGNSSINSVFGRPEDAGNEQSTTGPSIFDPVLCERAYPWFSALGAAVLDPFCGGSVRGIVAAYLGRHYTGIDLRHEQVSANEAQGQAITPDNCPTWLVGDSLEMETLLPEGALYDFIFSCPPYADLEVYSDDPRDISTMDYPAFLTAYREIIRLSIARLNDDRFACFVVGDVRDKKGHYYNFVGDTVQAFIDAGCNYYNEAVLVTAVGSLPIRAGRQFAAGRKLGKTHQNVLVFVKGDGKAATEWCGPVEVSDIAEAFGDVA